MTMTMTPGDVQIVPMTMTVAEVRMTFGRSRREHRSGLAVSRDVGTGSTATASRALPSPTTAPRPRKLLADYHRAFKPRPRPKHHATVAADGGPVRKLLFG